LGAVGTRIAPWAAVVLVGVSLTAPMTTASAAAQTSTPLYGVTIDRTTDIAKVVAAERTWSHRPTTRVYFSASEPASYYEGALAQLSSVSQVMGELLDSSDASRVSTLAYQSRVESYLSTLGSSVSIWEIGNEVNGNWTGPYATGSAKLTEAYEDVSARGAKTALTLYANEYTPDHCGDGTSELTPVQYSQAYVPASVRQGITYVFESYYPTQCHDTFPTTAEVGAEMSQLHALYPDALVGFGEVGLPHPATRRTLATATTVMSWAYRLDPGLAYYVGGYFWWYGRQDVFTGKKLLAGSMASALHAEAGALAGSG
jgi:hypothetical protein